MQAFRILLIIVGLVWFISGIAQITGQNSNEGTVLEIVVGAAVAIFGWTQFSKNRTIE